MLAQEACVVTLHGAPFRQQAPVACEGGLMVSDTAIVCGLLVALGSETVIVAGYVPAVSELVLYCTVIMFAGPVVEPLVGETVSHEAPSLML